MDKRTILAVVISVGIFFAVNLIYTNFFPQQKEEVKNSENAEKIELVDPVETKWNYIITPIDENLIEKDIKVETNVYKIIFSNTGGTIKSVELKNYELEPGKKMEMLFGGNSKNKAFEIYFGSHKNKAIDANFNYSKNSEKHEFSKVFEYYERGKEDEKSRFILKKIFTIKPEDYLIELNIYFENVDRQKSLPLNRENLSYTLGFGPQIGPEFKKIGERGGDYRKYFTYYDGKRKDRKIEKGKKTEPITDSFLWAGITGKYFTVIGIPYVNSLETLSFSEKKADNIPSGSQFYFSISAENNKPVIDDKYYFYIGPKINDVLNKYNKEENNGFKVKALNLNKIIDPGFPVLGWLEIIIKELLKFFYRIIPNYGIAILLTTLLIKAIVYPLTHKTYESTTKMQALQPKMEEIRNKHKDNPQKMNTEIAAFYKKEGVNPLGGCLPMLLQMPIMIAFYGLLSNHFDLRGAPFIGWITDLSSPESIYTLPFEIPFLGTEVRLLPLFMVVTQILSSKVMQTSNTASNNQMKMMSYAMPVVFLFILYNLPSGLILYWTVANVITTLQQIIINKILKKKTK